MQSSPTRKTSQARKNVGAGFPIHRKACTRIRDWMDQQNYMHAEREGIHWRIPILRRTKGCLSADLMRGENSSGQRFASIPAFTAAGDGAKNPGQVRRQCTKEYKIEVIERCIRREVLELPARARVPKDVVVVQHIGISKKIAPARLISAADSSIRKAKKRKTGKCVSICST